MKTVFDRGLGFLLLVLAATPVHPLAAQDEQEKLHPELAKQVEAALDKLGNPRSEADDLFVATILGHGDLAPLLRWLEQRMKETAEGEVDARRRVSRLQAALLRRRGDLADALRALETIPADHCSARDALDLAEVLDALGRDEKALTAYDRVLELTADAALRNRILLRKALLQKSGDDEKEVPPLAKFASEEGRSSDLKNQAAVILALQKRKEAIGLFEVSGEGTKRYQQEVRLAEWALESEAYDRAQEFAWRATRSAKMKRDRRYGLTVLAESHRRDESLGTLIDRLTKEEELDAESRNLWIDLLRETGRVDEALDLFRNASEGRFTVEMRRELLEMCRETGQEQVLVDAYRRMVAEEPRFIEWREGLSRYHLERGDRDRALAVWAPYLELAEDNRYVMAAAATLRDLGLDDLAVSFAEHCRSDPTYKDQVGLFLFEMHLDRGRMAQARAALKRLDESAEADAGIRMDLADAYGRVGDKKKAVDVLAALGEARGERAGSDLNMKLALLLSEIGEEEQALDKWYGLWGKIASIPRRRYVEDRIMTVAARLGRLAKIAVDLETRLTDGTASDREAGLLIRLYTKVGDSVSATEVVEEHLKKTGGDPVTVLREKSRVYLSCTDYYNYEICLKELVKLDSENASDHLRQLAMSNLERGQRREAKQVLEELKSHEGDAVSAEFEAGVLALAGLRDEAMRSYQKALARHSERIDTYLLLSNLMKEVGLHDRSAGMFQYLAETAEKDDLFTIAIDGILNMRDGRGNTGAPDRLVEWARRITLERLARRPDKLYLYQLVADLSEEIRDRGMAIRALKAAIPIAGEQRTPLLRELMAMAKGREGDRDRRMFGRRLLGQGELVPPQVYLDLGDSFLLAGDVANASKTFNQASKLPEFREMQRKIAASFEKARYPKEALRVYERLLSAETSDVDLIARVAELQEQIGRDDLASELYRRGIDLLLSRRPLSATEAKKKDTDDVPPHILRFRSRNVDDFAKYWASLQSGFLATAADAAAIEQHLDLQLNEIDADLAKRGESEEKTRTLEGNPRIRDRAAFYRRASLATGLIARADALDAKLLQEFPEDEKLLETLTRSRIQWGLKNSARRLIDGSGRPQDVQRRLRFLAGARGDAAPPGIIPISEAARLIVPLLAQEREADARDMLGRLDFSTGEKTDLEHVPQLVSAAVYLSDPDLGLAIFRHWINLLVRHGGPNIYSGVSTILRQSRMLLGKEKRASLIQHLVSAMVDNPEKASAIINQLEELRKTAGDDLLTPEQVEKLIDSQLAKSKEGLGGVHGIANLFVLLPSEERGLILRKMWPRIPKSQSAWFLLQLLPKLEDPISQSLGDFLVASFEKAVKESKDAWQLDHVTPLVGLTEENLDVSLRFLEVLTAKDAKKPQYRSARARILAKLGKTDEALALTRTVMEELYLAKATDYRVTQARNELINEFFKDHAQLFHDVLDKLEKKSGKSLELTSRRLDLVRRRGDVQAELLVLRKALEDHPDKGNFRKLLASRLRRLKRDYEAAVLEEEGLNDKDRSKNKSKDRTQRRSIARAWMRLEHPLRAKEILDAIEEDKKAEKKKEVNRRPPSPRPTPSALKKAWEAKDFAKVRLLFRRLWRTFPDRNARYPSFYSYTRSIAWPADRSKPKRTIQRGGMPKALLEPPPEKAPETPPATTRAKTAQSILVERDDLAKEIERQLRCIEPAQLDGGVAQDILASLAAREESRVGAEKALEPLLSAVKNGTAGKKEFGLLFAHLEKDPERVRGDAAATVEGLLATVNAKDTAQLRRLARLYARLGEQERASALYRWCATGGLGGRLAGFGPGVTRVISSVGGVITVYEGGFPTNRPRDILSEVTDLLKGAAREKALEAILAYSDPGDDNPWGRDSYDQRVLRTWEKVLGPAGALERCNDICESVTELGKQPKRMTARIVARLLARAGRTEDAIACLEIALCSLEPPAKIQEWFRTSFTNKGSLGTADLQTIFPAQMDGWEDPKGWLLAAADAVEGWIDADRVHKGGGFRILATLALRLHGIGETDRAAALLERVKAAATGNMEDQLWVVDAARHLGNTELAGPLELKLLDERRIYLDRIPEVIENLAKRDGPAAALEKAREVATWTLHPGFLERVTALARDLGNEEELRHWTDLAERAAKTRKEVDAILNPKKKPTEPR